MTSPDSTSTGADLTAERFLLWALGCLRVQFVLGNDGVYEFAVPEALRSGWDEADTIRFAFRQQATEEAPVRSARLGSPFWKQTIELLRGRSQVVPARPRGQPASAHQIAPRLFAHYHVEGGGVRLGGCTLEDVPLLRYTFRIVPRSAASHGRLVHIFRSPDGRPLDQELRRTLRVDDLLPAEDKPPRLNADDAARWRAFGRQQAPIVASDERAEFVLATAIWCRQVRCKLLFEIGDARGELAVCEWAQLLADGTVPPPPFRCPATGLESYRVVATDDGRVTVPEALANCEESGRCVLSTDLETCAVTGRRVLPEYLATCPVTSNRLRQSALVACSVCRQPVSPQCLRAGSCEACRGLRKVSADDPRLARVLGEHPQLDRWSSWRMSETAEVYVLAASRFLRRLLVVVDKQTLRLRHVAEAGSLARRWTAIVPEQWESYLK